MARVSNGRMTADIEGDFVVFLIGMRFNKPWKLHKWWAVVRRDARACSRCSTSGPSSGSSATSCRVHGRAAR